MPENKSGGDVSYDDLPHHLMMSILTRLSPRDVLISMRVCKSWRAIIHDSLFPHRHLQHSRRCASSVADDRKAILIIGGTHHDCLQRSLEIERQHNRLMFDDTRYSLVASCDGLVLLSAAYNMLLWNPAIRKIKHVPPVTPETNLDAPPLAAWAVGLGCIEYDNHNKHDYKIVKFWFRYPRQFRIPNDQVMVYTLSSNSWRRIRAIPPRVVPLTCGMRHGCTCFYKGSVHWPAKAEGLGGSFGIIGFDVKEEVFWEALIPVYARRPAHSVDWILGEWEGLLSVGMHFGNEEGMEVVEIWVMKEHRVADSWSKLFVVESATQFLYPLGCVKEKTRPKVLLENRYGDVVVCNCINPNRSPTQDKDPMPPPAHGFTTHLESLALLHDPLSIYAEHKYDEHPLQNVGWV